MSLPLQLSLVFLLSALFCYGLTALFLSYATRHNLIDLPGPRRSHEIATPRGGGAGIVLVLFTAMIGVGVLDSGTGNWLAATFPGLLLVAGLGWADDHRPVSSLLRLLGQLAAAVWFVAVVDSTPRFFFADAPGFLDIVQQIFAVLLIVWITNVQNFMDGSDWMAASQALLIFLFLAFGAYVGSRISLLIIAIAAAGACAGFLPWNRTPAKIFMGDVGSGALGFLMVCLVLAPASSQAGAGIGFLVLFGAFFFDALFTLLKRFIGGQKWYTAHREHAYQKLVHSGWSHLAVAAMYSVATLVFYGPLSILADQSPGYAAWLLLLAGFLSFIAWACVQYRCGAKTVVKIEADLHE